MIEAHVKIRLSLLKSRDHYRIEVKFDVIFFNYFSHL